MTDQPPSRILIDPPDASTILAARHLDATEGPVQAGSIVDASTRSAITCVLDYVAKAHNSYAEADSADAAAGSYAGRAEQAEAERDAARATNRRLNLRAQQLESELTAYRRAISTWEFTERGTYVPLRSITAMGKAAGVGFDGTRYELHYERMERAEAQLAAVADLIADHEGDEWAAHPATTTLRGILDGEEYAMAQPEPWLHITFTSPDPTTANTSALTLADFVRAEFPSVRMRISSNAVEAAPSCSANNPETAPNNPAATEATEAERQRAMRAYGINALGRIADEASEEASRLRDQVENARTTCRITATLACMSEADVSRVIDLYEQWVKDGPPPLGVPTARWWDRRLVELRAAIQPPAEQHPDAKEQS